MLIKQYMKYPIFFSFLFFLGSIQSSQAQEVSGNDKVSFIPPSYRLFR